ncbi:MAG: hypothetical protein JXQ27_09080 [Acidobacteria bacterium]|nr:hypothetical protein [Acidobacteriota bacterium]
MMATAHYRRPSRRLPGRWLATMLLLAGLVACQNPRWRAHTYNERGIVHYRNGAYAEARPEFEKSIAEGVTPEIPTYNLANTWLAREDYVQAHEEYQAALNFNPRLMEAHFNDGHALARWGETFVRIPDESATDEVDWCALAAMMRRAIDLLEQAEKRFQRVAILEKDRPLGREAEENAAALGERLEELRRLEEEYRRRCQARGGGGGGTSGSAATGGQADPGRGGEEGTTGSAGEPPPTGSENSGGSSSATSGTGSGSHMPQPLSEEERQQLQQALQRIQQQARQSDRTFRQSAPQQFRKDEGERYQGKPIWW